MNQTTNILADPEIRMEHLGECLLPIQSAQKKVSIAERRYFATQVMLK
jgi:hypothetical protein